MNGVSRRALLRGGVALAAGGGAVGAADLAMARGGGRDRLRIGYLPITDAAPLLVAHAQGRYSQAGLAVDRPVLFGAWESLAQAFLDGDVDVVHLLMPPYCPQAARSRLPAHPIAFRGSAALGARTRVGSRSPPAIEVTSIRRCSGSSIGRWGRVNILGERHWVHKRFHDQIAAADYEVGFA